MADHTSSESIYVPIPTFRNDFAQPETGGLSQPLLANEPPPPAPVSSHSASVRRGSAGLSNTTEDRSIELEEYGSIGNAVSQKPSEILQPYIYWSSPALMTGAFVVGVLFAVGHHLFYQSLDGQEVGDSDRQQWSLRYLGQNIPGSS